MNWKSATTNRSVVGTMLWLALSAAVCAESLAIISPPPDYKFYSQNPGNEVPVHCAFKNIVKLYVNGEPVKVEKYSNVVLAVKLDGFGRKTLHIVAVDDNNRIEEYGQPISIIRTFPDIDNHWATREIQYLATLGYLGPRLGGANFAPDSPVSRAELAQVLVKSRKVSLNYLSATEIRDVLRNHWAVPYIVAAIENNMLDLDKKCFYPESLVTRADAISAICRTFKIQENPLKKRFLSDVPEKFWARDDIYAAMVNKVLPGKWDLKEGLNPGFVITRAELAALIARVPEIRKEIVDLERSKVDFDFSYLIDTPEKSYAAKAEPETLVTLFPKDLYSNNRAVLKIAYNTNLTKAAGNVDKVQIDLTALGKLYNTAMLDDGMWGDSYAGDGVYYVEAVPSTGILSGEKNIPIKVVDRAGKSYDTKITVNIREPEPEEENPGTSVSKL